MKEIEYRAWLALQEKEQSTQNTSASMIKRIEGVYGDLDAAFNTDGLQAVLSDLAYSGVDRRNNEPNPSLLIIDGDIYNGLASARTHLNYYMRFLENRTTLSVEVPLPIPAPSHLVAQDDTEPVEAVLSLERDLNAALRQNIEQLEKGLKVIDGGKERSVASGRIDILAEDASGKKVIIELKAVKAPRDAVAQVLAYMGDIFAENGSEVRGLLVAPEFDPKAVSAARMVPTLELKRFSFQFSFETVRTKEFGPK